MAKSQHRAAVLRRRAHLNLQTQDGAQRSPTVDAQDEGEEEDEEDETWDAPLQRLRVYPVANAQALLWVCVCIYSVYTHSYI